MTAKKKKETWCPYDGTEQPEDAEVALCDEHAELVTQNWGKIMKLAASNVGGDLQRTMKAALDDLKAKKIKS